MRQVLIFQRALQREFTHVAGGVFVALFAITLTTQLIRLLGQAAGGRIVSEGVLALLGFGALQYLAIILTLTLFISILLTISRSYRDSEMIVWFASGLPLTAWIKPVLKFAFPVVCVVAALSLFLSPWAQSKSNEFRKKMESRDDVSRVTPGAFAESARSDRVFFVENIAGQQDVVKNIFISSIQHGRLGIMVSNRGIQETMPNGDRFLVLLNGRRYEGTPGTAEYRVMEFERYAVRIETKEALGFDETPARVLPVWELIVSPTSVNLAELLWRIGLPVSGGVLALLAIPLAFVNPRAGRANNLVMAILVYMVYSNLLAISQAWVASGKLRFEIGVWAVHVAMAVILISLFYRRIAVFSWMRFRR